MAVPVAVLLVVSGCATSGAPVEGGPSAEQSTATGQLSPRPTGTSPAASTPAGRSVPAAELVVEIHVPLTPTPGLAKGAYAYPWIDEVEQYLAELDGSHGEEYDDGEELGKEYLFFVSGAPETELIELARRVSRLEGVPDGVYARVNTSAGDMGEGRRVELG